MAERLKKSILYTYGVADMFFLLLADLELFYFTIFLTDYARFSMATGAIILSVTGVVDIVCAFIAGIILQKATLKFGGKYRSWFLIGPPLFAPLFVLQFTKIGGELSAAFIIIFCFLTSHLLWNVVYTASGAMVNRLSRLPEEITILSTNRAQGMSAAGLIFSVAGWPLIMFFAAHTSEVTGFTLATTAFAICMILGYWYVYKITAGKDPYEESPAADSKNEAGLSVRETIRLVFDNPPLLWLVTAETFRNTYYAILMAFAVYYFKYVVRDLAFLSVFLLATSIAALMGSFAATWIGVKFGKRHSYWVFLILAAAGSAAARLPGLTPWSFTGICSIATFVAGIASAMSTGLFSDTVVYGEWKTGKNIRAFTMSLANVAIKLSILIRSVTVILGLAAIGFVSNAAPSPKVVGGITSIMTLAPAAACLLAAVIFYAGYKIEDKHVLRMQDEIAARTAGEFASVNDLMP
jgi:GPH family glycoside/pentoside/hexuronide:cation symporter/glucuronide carrier protein